MPGNEIIIDWIEDNATLVDEPLLLTVRKVEAEPADLIEELDDARAQLHAAVDRFVDRAVDGFRRLDRALMRSEEMKRALAEELELVVRHSNALVIASTQPARRDDTVRDPTRDTVRDITAQIRVRQKERPTVERLCSSRAGVLRVA